jgi:hydrogenase maturation protease
MRILITGVGNVLRGDDGFGIAVAEELRHRNRFGANVEIMEAGIAGISLVQELMNGYDALIVADTIDRGGEPGTIYVVEPEAPKIEAVNANELHRSLVDAHCTDPSKVLLLAAALKVLPQQVFLVGCQPESIEDATEGLSDSVRAATTVAVRKIESLIEDQFSAA